MTPIVTHCTQAQAQQIDKFRQRGFTWNEISEAMGISAHTVSRYHRVLNRYGIESFALNDQAQRNRIVGQYRRRV